jgi:predicted permease
MYRKALASLRSLTRKGRTERELDEEIGFHLEREVEKNLGRGMTPEQARAAAVASFGGVEKIKDECRDETGARFLETLSQDIRYGIRSLRKNPGFSIVAILTLALGIGANTAIFSVVHGVLLQSLPYGGGERLVRIRHDAPGAGDQGQAFSAKEIADYREQSRVMDGLVEYHSMSFVLLGRKEPERVRTGVVSAEFFDVLGVRPILGRSFLPGEDKPGAEAVLVLSYDYWVRSFGADRSIVGRAFKMNDRVHTVVGVLPAIPGYPDENDVYMPVSACPFRSAPSMAEDRDMRMVNLYGRLKPGVTLSAARTDLATVAGRLRQQYPKSYPAKSGYTASAVPIREELTRQARPTFLILLAMVGLVLLLACANVANLTIARLMRRGREIALRTALGAGRARLTRQLLTESGILSLCGGALGLALAAGGMRLLVAFAARFSPRAAEIRIDGPVLLFTLAISLGTAIGFGLVSAASSDRDIATALQDGGERATGGVRINRLRKLLIVAQVAISFLLLTGAGLMVRTFWKLQSVNPGFQSDHVLTMTVDLNWTRYNDNAKRLAFWRPMLERVRTLPGVRTAGVAIKFPLNDSGPFNTGFRIERRPQTPGDPVPQTDFRIASTDYFATIGLPLVNGRFFQEDDREDAPLVSIVNEAMAHRFWSGRSPLGERVSLDEGKTWRTIVGVIGDVKQYGLDKPAADELYLPYAQYPPLGASLLVRTIGEPLSVARKLRETIYALDPTQPVADVRTLDQLRDNSLSSPRLTAVLLVLFAAVALTITAAGITGVLAFSISQRTQEFGIRVALGAQPIELLGMVVRQGMALVAAGLAIGFAGSLAGSQLLSGLLFGVTAHDPLTFAGVLLLLSAVAALACFVPARRATHVDPMITLRAT